MTNRKQDAWRRSPRGGRLLWLAWELFSRYAQTITHGNRTRSGTTTNHGRATEGTPSTSFNFGTGESESRRRRTEAQARLRIEEGRSDREWLLPFALRFAPTTVMSRNRLLGIGRADRADHFTGRLRSGLPERPNPRRRYRNEVRSPGVTQLGKPVFGLLQVFVERLFDGRAFFQKLPKGSELTAR